MSEEMNENFVQKERECKCFCHSECFKDFLKIALGSFVGVFCALSLFAALHKPPVCPMMPHPMFMPPMHQHHHFDRGQKGDFHKVKLERKNFERKIPVKVEVED